MGKTKNGESGDDGGFGAENGGAERGFQEARGEGGGEFVVGPTAFGADGKGGGGGPLPFQDGAERGSGGAFRKEQIDGRNRRGHAMACPNGRKGVGRAGGGVEDRRAEAAGLLGGFEEDFQPAGGAFPCCGDERLFAAGGGKRNNLGDAEFGGFFERPFEAVKFDDGEQECEVEAIRSDRERLDEREVNGGFGDAVDAGEPKGRAVREFIELAGRGAEDAAQMVRHLPAQGSTLPLEMLHKETAAHSGVYTMPRTVCERHAAAWETQPRRTCSMAGSMLIIVCVSTQASRFPRARTYTHPRIRPAGTPCPKASRKAAGQSPCEGQRVFR